MFPLKYDTMALPPPFSLAPHSLILSLFWKTIFYNIVDQTSYITSCTPLPLILILSWGKHWSMCMYCTLYIHFYNWKHWCTCISSFTIGSTDVHVYPLLQLEALMYCTCISSFTIGSTEVHVYPLLQLEALMYMYLCILFYNCML